MDLKLKMSFSHLYKSNTSKRCNADCSTCYDKRQLYYKSLRNYSDNDSDNDSDIDSDSSED